MGVRGRQWEAACRTPRPMKPRDYPQAVNVPLRLTNSASVMKASNSVIDGRSGFKHLCRRGKMPRSRNNPPTPRAMGTRSLCGYQTAAPDRRCVGAPPGPACEMSVTSADDLETRERTPSDARGFAAAPVVRARTGSGNGADYCQPACKPGSVSGRAARRPFLWDGPCGPPLATHPNDWPGERLAVGRNPTPRRPYSVLLPVGFTMPPLLPAPRWALTPPFHPYPATHAAHARVARYVEPHGRRGGLISVALSLGSPPPDVIRHRLSVEPGLSSPAAFRHVTGAAARPADGPSVGEAGPLVNRNAASSSACPRRTAPSTYAKAPVSALAMRPAAGRGRAEIRFSRVRDVEASATPSTRAGRKWRWNAAVACTVAASNRPVGATS